MLTYVRLRNSVGRVGVFKQIILIKRIILRSAQLQDRQLPSLRPVLVSVHAGVVAGPTEYEVCKSFSSRLLPQRTAHYVMYNQFVALATEFALENLINHYTDLHQRLDQSLPTRS